MHKNRKCFFSTKFIDKKIVPVHVNLNRNILQKSTIYNHILHITHFAALTAAKYNIL